MMQLGDFTPGKTATFWFTTVNVDGVPAALTSGAASVYKQGTTTESTAGVSLSTNYDSRTGFHEVEVDTSADGAFYAAGKDFAIVLTAGTVEGRTITPLVLANFSLSNRSALRPATADRTLAVDASGQVTVGALASDSITASAIAADAIGSSELAASAITEIQSGLSTLDAAGVRTAIGLASANLDVQLAAIAAYVDTEVAAIKAVTDQFAAAQGEPSSAPAANATPLQKIAWLAALARNKVEQTSTTQTLKADDGSTTIATAAVSDDGTTFTRSEWS